MTRSALLGTTLAVWAAGCGQPSVGPRVLAGSEELLLVAPERSVTVATIPVGTQINEILPDPPSGVWLATWAGLTRVSAPLDGSAVTTTTDSLGTLDGIERDARTGLLYLLQHPGNDPSEVTEDHVVAEWDPRSREALRTWTVDRLSYDLHLDPDRGILVTPLRGRRLWWVSFADDASHPIDLPPAPGRTPRVRSLESVDGGASYVRIGAVLPGGKGVVVVEQGLPDRNRVWFLRPDDTIEGFDLPRSCHYQGGVLAPDGHTLLLNAIDAVEVVDLRTRTEAAWIPLDRPHFRIAVDSDGRHCYLTAPEQEASRGRITTVDLVEERVVRRSALAVRADAIAIWSP